MSKRKKSGIERGKYRRIQCYSCGRWFNSYNGETICSDVCADNLEADCAADMDLDEYYFVKGHLPGQEE